MGRFTNPVLVAAGAALIVVGVAARTGTVNLAGQAGARQGANTFAPPEVSPSPPASPTPAPSPPSAAAGVTQGGGGQGDGGDGGD